MLSIHLLHCFFAVELYHGNKNMGIFLDQYDICMPKYYSLYFLDSVFLTVGTTSIFSCHFWALLESVSKRSRHCVSAVTGQISTVHLSISTTICLTLRLWSESVALLVIISAATLSPHHHMLIQSVFECPSQVPLSFMFLPKYTVWHLSVMDCVCHITFFFTLAVTCTSVIVA